MIAVCGNLGKPVGQTGPLVADLIEVLFLDLLFVHIKIQTLVTIADVDGSDEIILALESELQILLLFIVDGDIAGQDHYCVLGYPESGFPPLIPFLVLEGPAIRLNIVSFVILRVNLHAGIRNGDRRIHAVYGQISGHANIDMVEISCPLINLFRFLHSPLFALVCVGGCARGKHGHDHQNAKQC